MVWLDDDDDVLSIIIVKQTEKYKEVYTNVKQTENNDKQS